jgi:hypothetical protein
MHKDRVDVCQVSRIGVVVFYVSSNLSESAVSSLEGKATISMGE